MKNRVRKAPATLTIDTTTLNRDCIVTGSSSAILPVIQRLEMPRQWCPIRTAWLISKRRADDFAAMAELSGHRIEYVMDGRSTVEIWRAARAKARREMLGGVA